MACVQVMYEQKLAHTRGLAASIASGLSKMNEAKLDVNRMKVHPCPAVFQSARVSLLRTQAAWALPRHPGAHRRCATSRHRGLHASQL